MFGWVRRDKYVFVVILNDEIMGICSTESYALDLVANLPEPAVIATYLIDYQRKRKKIRYYVPKG